MNLFSPNVGMFPHIFCQPIPRVEMIFRQVLVRLRCVSPAMSRSVRINQKERALALHVAKMCLECDSVGFWEANR